jgi:hypothetical protein
MEKEKLEIYSDYLICTNGFATATGLSAVLDGEISHDKITRFLSEREYRSKDLWKEVKSTVRQIEREDGCLIFDDTIQEKAWTDEHEVMCWHYDPCQGRTVRGINRLNAVYYRSEVSIPVASQACPVLRYKDAQKEAGKPHHEKRTAAGNDWHLY